MADTESTPWSSAVVRGAFIFILLGIFIGGSLINRLRITSAIQKNGTVTTGTVLEAYDRFYAVPFIKYSYTVGGNTYEKEASVMGVGNYETLGPNTPIQVSYVVSRPRTALPTARVGVDERDMNASVFCSVVPLVLGLLMVLIVELTRPASSETESH